MSAMLAALRERLGPSGPFAPTRRLALLVAAVAPLWLLSGWPAGFRVALALQLLVVAAGLGDAILLPAARDVVVERSAPTVIGVGDEEALRYEVTSRWNGALAATLHQALPPHFLTFEAGGRPFDLPARGGATLTLPVVGRSRGETPLGAVALRVRSRLG